VSQVLSSTEPTYKVYRISWANPNPTADLAGYKVFISGTNEFTPSEANLQFDGVSLGVSHVVNLDVSGKHPAQYVRVRAYDIWGNEVIMAPQIAIPAVI
jgi:hypothetical protein